MLLEWINHHMSDWRLKDAQVSEAYGAVVMLNGTKFGAFPCVTKPKAVRAEGFPTLGGLRC